jgi:hypothetical protein
MIGWGLCYPFYQTPDTVVESLPSSLAQSVVWSAHDLRSAHADSFRYHRNYYVNSTYNYYNNTLWQQGVDPSIVPDPFINLTFGGAMYSSALNKSSPTSLQGMVVSVFALMRTTCRHWTHLCHCRHRAPHGANS